VDAVAAWMKSNRLQLNPAKTEVLWCATSRRRHQLPTTAMLTDGSQTGYRRQPSFSGCRCPHLELSS